MGGAAERDFSGPMVASLTFDPVRTGNIYSNCPS
jgi:hypothetical protein